MTLINPKYTYEKLKRVEVDGKRRYAAPGGPPVASVTTILSGTKDMRPAVFDFAHDNGLKILNLQLKNESLEQLFKKLTV